MMTVAALEVPIGHKACYIMLVLSFSFSVSYSLLTLMFILKTASSLYYSSTLHNVDNLPILVSAMSAKVSTYQAILFCNSKKVIDNHKSGYVDAQNQLALTSH